MAAIQSARLVDGADPGPLRAVRVIRTGYVPGEAFPTQGDTTPPVVSNVSPVSGSTVARTATLHERVTDAQALKGVTILVLVPGERSETIYDGRLVDGVWSGSFHPGYEGSSITPATGGFDFGMTRTGGWYGASWAIRTRAHDGNSNE